MMPAADIADRLRGEEAGFTLIEVLAAMSLSLIVLLAILDVFDGFSSSASRQTRMTDANERVRMTMDRIVSDLRQVQTIEVADPNDLVYTVTDSATQVRRERICLDASSRLWRSSVTTASAPTEPIASGTACPTADSGAAQITHMLSANSGSNSLFAYDSAIPAEVRSVGLTFALDAGDAGRTDVSTLRASAFVRARSETALPHGDDDIVTTCGESGEPTLTLSAAVGPLTVSYSDIDGNALGAAVAGEPVVLPGGTETVVAKIASSSGAVIGLVKRLAC